MRYLLLVALVSAAGLTGCESYRAVTQGTFNMSEEQREAIADTIRYLNEQFFSAAERLDADAMASYLAESPYSAFAGGGDLAYSVDVAHETLQNGYSQLQSQDIEMGEVSVSVLAPDAAAATGIALFEATDLEGNASDGLEIFTLVWVRRNGQWRIQQSHFSSRITRLHGQTPADPPGN